MLRLSEVTCFKYFASCIRTQGIFAVEANITEAA